jgi:hypothetical protein
LVLICQSAAVAQMALSPRPACPPGCKVVEEIVMKEQPRFCCVVVPNIKKKWVHETVDDGFCIPHSPLHQRGCDKVPHCRSCTRKLLVKKQVEECAGYKCEVKKTMEMVPCKVYRIVPCDAGAAALPQADPMPPAADMQRDNVAPANAANVAGERARLLPYFLLDRAAFHTNPKR